MVTRTEQEDGVLFLPRNIEDTPIERDDDTEVAGYLTPAGLGDPDYRFDAEQSSWHANVSI